MADGIGSYFSPSPVRPVHDPISHPAHHTSGLGAYFSPSPIRPVSAPIAHPAHSIRGLGQEEKPASPVQVFGAMIGISILLLVMIASSHTEGGR